MAINMKQPATFWYFALFCMKMLQSSFTWFYKKKEYYLPYYLPCRELAVPLEFMRGFFNTLICIGYN